MERIIGTSIINHAKRVKLEVSIEQYAVLTFLDYAEASNKVINADLVYSQLGFDFKYFIKIKDDLSQIGFIHPETRKLTKKWYDTIGDIDSQFIKFWEPIVINNIRYSWPGSKTDAKDKFAKAVKEVGFDFLMEQKEAYFKVVNESKFDRQVMGGPVFLNPKTKRYSENWKSQVKQPVKSVSEEESKPFGVNEFKGLME